MEQDPEMPGAEALKCEKYPDLWQGVLPEGYKEIVAGLVTIQLDLYYNLEFLEHLAFPRWIPLEELRVLNAACGTGEGVIYLAMKYPGVSFTATDMSEGSLQQAIGYARELGLKNVDFLPADPAEWDLRQDFHIIQFTRLIQHFTDPLAMLNDLKKHLKPDGILAMIADAAPLDPAWEPLREELQGLRREPADPAGEVEVVRQIVDSLAGNKSSPLRGISDLLEKVGFRIITGLHPRNYDPRNYLQNPEAGALFAEMSRLEQACLAEIMSASMTRHHLVCGHAGFLPDLPGIKDRAARTCIPFRSPYSFVALEEGRAVIGQNRKHIMLSPEIEYDDISVPARLAEVFLAIDGFKSFEQIHRRFLPMAWDVFWYFMEVLDEAGLIYLHR